MKKNLLLKIFKHYGYETQLRKLNEENYELLQALIENNNVIIDEEQIMEEIADVLVVIQQFIAFFDLDIEKIKKIENFKVRRTLLRIRQKNQLLQKMQQYEKGQKNENNN